jgi:hypothetical protein
MRGGKREGAGRPPGTFAKKKKVTSSIVLWSEDWALLDKIESSRGKAVEKLIAFFKENQ